jgi:hypothetical protein
MEGVQPFSRAATRSPIDLSPKFCILFPANFPGECSTSFSGHVSHLRRILLLPEDPLVVLYTVTCLFSWISARFVASLTYFTLFRHCSVVLVFSRSWQRTVLFSAFLSKCFFCFMFVLSCVCLSTCGAWLLWVKKARFVSAEGQELRTDSQSRSWRPEDSSWRFWAA